MPAKQLTPEEKANIAQQMYIGAVPYVDKAYNRDPKTLIGNSALAAARSTAPVAGGNWGIAEGLARVGQGFLGHEINKRQEEKYRNLDVQEAQRLQRAGMDPLRTALGLKQDDTSGVVASPGAVPQVAQPAGPPPIDGPVNNVASALSTPNAPPPGTQIPLPPGIEQQMPPGVPPDPTGGSIGVAPGRTVQGPAAAPVAGQPRRQQGVARPPAAGVPQRQQMAQSARAQSRNAFSRVYDGFVAPAEGGYNPRDPNTGMGVNYGIDQKANPDVNDKNLSAGQAKQIMYDRYWKPSGAENLPEALQAIHFDTYVLNPSKAKQFLAESNGDPVAYMGMRRNFLNSINGPHKGWENRNQALERFTGIDGQQAGEGAPAEQAELPDLPSVTQEKPTAPSLGERVRSSRLQVAYNLLNDPQGQGDSAALAYAAAAPYLEQGWEDEQKIKDDRAADEAALANIGYQGDINRYNADVEDVRKAQIEDRQAIRDQQYGQANTEQEYGLRMKQDAANNQADIIAAQVKAGPTSGAQLAADYGVPQNADGTPRTDGLWGVISGGGPINKRPITGAPETRLEALARQSERIDALRKGFDDAYFGAGTKWIGDAWNKVDEVTGMGNQKRVEWWKMYNAMDAKEIHDLYGAALTGGEEARWNATVINTGTSAEAARRNLDERTKILNTALARNARAAATVYNQEQVWELIGGDAGARRIDEYEPLYKAKGSKPGSKPSGGGTQAPPSRFKTSGGGEAYYDAKTGKWMMPDDAPAAPPRRTERPPGQSRADWNRAQRGPDYLYRRQ